MHVAALILSLADHVLLCGESDQSVAGEAKGEAPMPASRSEAPVRLRLSLCAGVGRPPYTDPEPFTGLAVGRARKKRCETRRPPSTVATTAAAPAVKAKLWPEGRLSKALAEPVVVPMTCLSARLASGRLAFIGERSVFLIDGECDAGSLRELPHGGLLIRGWAGVRAMLCTSKL